MKYGDHVASEPHITGSWDMTKMDRGAMLTGWEGFMAVRYCPGEWALYFDVDDNGLKGVVGDEMLRVEVELARLRPPEPRLQRTITRNDEE